MNAILNLTDSIKIEIKKNDEEIQYKYSNEKKWKITKLKFFPRIVKNEIKFVAGFSPSNGMIFYIDEFLPIADTEINKKIKNIINNLIPQFPELKIIQNYVFEISEETDTIAFIPNTDKIYINKLWIDNEPILKYFLVFISKMIEYNLPNDINYEIAANMKINQELKSFISENFDCPDNVVINKYDNLSIDQITSKIKEGELL